MRFVSLVLFCSQQMMQFSNGYKNRNEKTAPTATVDLENFRDSLFSSYLIKY